MNQEQPKWVNATGAVEILNELLEELEYIYGMDDVQDRLWSILKEHGVIDGRKYELT